MGATCTANPNLKRAYVALVLTGIWSFPAFAVEGTISSNTTWETDQIVTNHLTVAAGAILTINPGVKVRVIQNAGGDMRVTVRGGLRILGTTARPVVFTSAESSPEPGDWQGIIVESGAMANNAINNVEIRYARTALTVAADDAAVRGISALFCGADTAIVLRGQRDTLEHAFVYNGRGAGVLLGSGSGTANNLIINGCSGTALVSTGFAGNTRSLLTRGCGGDGVVIAGGAGKVTYATIDSATGRGVMMRGGYTGVIDSSIVRTCGRAGIEVNGADGVVRNCAVADCGLDSMPEALILSGSPSLVANTFDNDAHSNLKVVVYDGTPVVRHNNLSAVDDTTRVFRCFALNLYHEQSSSSREDDTVSSEWYYFAPEVLTRIDYRTRADVLLCGGSGAVLYNEHELRDSTLASKTNFEVSLIGCTDVKSRWRSFFYASFSTWGRRLKMWTGTDYLFDVYGGARYTSRTNDSVYVTAGNRYQVVELKQSDETIDMTSNWWGTISGIGDVIGQGYYANIDWSSLLTSANPHAGPRNEPPVADAGSAITGDIGTDIALDGSGSSDGDGDDLTYWWVAAPGNPGGVGFSSNYASSAVNATFRPEAVGDYTFYLM